MYPFINMLLNPVSMQAGMRKPPLASMMDETEQDILPTLQKPSFMDAYRELLTRKPGPAMSEYKRYLEQGYPTQEEYKPGKINRLAAALSGAATGFVNPAQGPQVVEEILTRPYRRALERYKQEGSRLERGAALEEQQYGRDITAARELRQLENQEADNRRADVLARSLIRQRNLSMERTQQLIDEEGRQSVYDDKSGILYLIYPDGRRLPIGKFKQSTGEKISDERDMKLYESRLSEGRARRLEDVRFGHAKEMEKERQKGRVELVGKRGEETIKAIRERGKISHSESSSQKIRANYFKVDARAKTDPEKYGDVWVVNPMTGYPDLNPEMSGTPEYQELHRILYEGFEQSTTAPRTIGKYQVK